MTNEDGAWFAPKSHGYGAGLPVAWQGWLLLLVYFCVMAALALTIAQAHHLLYLALSLIATAAMIVVVARTTRGGWRWRWGRGR